jgi:hypothetical protein
MKLDAVLNDGIERKVSAQAAIRQIKNFVIFSIFGFIPPVAISLLPLHRHLASIS